MSAARLPVEDRWPLLIAPLALLGLLGMAAVGTPAELLTAAAFGTVLVVGGLCLTAFIDVAWLFSGALALTVFAGNWGQIGLPGMVSLDRLLLVVAIVVFLLRDPALGRRPYVRLTPAHVVLGLAAAYALCSTVAAGTIGDAAALAPLLDRFGVIPFLLFLIAPAAFASEHQRRILLGTLMAVGAYLGLVAFFEGIGLNALVFPRYIVELNPEVQAGRARGPFAAAAVNGVALYFCAVACAVAYATMPKPWTRRLALAIGALCLFSLIFTQERSVWVGAIAATVIACLLAPPLRAKLVFGAIAAAVALAAAFVLVPDLQQSTGERIGEKQTEWERLNMNHAAVDMVLDKPLLGFGLGTFKENSEPHFQLNPDYPLSATDTELHNLFLSYAVELGLVGVTLWVVGFALAIGGAILVRGPPELYPWRIGLIAIALMWLVVAGLVPMVQPFPNYLLWLWAGVVWPWRYAWSAEEGAGDERAINR